MYLKDYSVLVLLFLAAACGKGLDVNSESSSEGGGPKIIRISTSTLDGDFSNGSNAAAAKANADALCAGEVAGYKAMIASSVRYPNTGSGSSDWVLKPNTQYLREDGVTVIGTTNTNGTFDDVGSIIFEDSVGTTGGVKAWTGLGAAWDTDANCNNWTQTAGTGMTGDTASISTNAISDSNEACTGSYHLYCVQQ